MVFLWFVGVQEQGQVYLFTGSCVEIRSNVDKRNEQCGLVNISRVADWVNDELLLKQRDWFYPKVTFEPVLRRHTCKSHEAQVGAGAARVMLAGSS